MIMLTKNYLLPLVSVIALLTTTIAPFANQEQKSAKLFPQFAVVDLTHPLKEGIPVYPGGEPFKITKLVDFQQGYYMNKISMGEHCGTHVDAPIHFIQGGKSVAEVPLERLIGPLVVLDVEKAAAANPDLEITPQHIREWEKIHDQIPTNAFVVGRTDWWKKWGVARDYINMDSGKVAHFPGFSADAARYLMAERKVAGLGIDTLSIDPGNSKEFPAHRIVLKAGAVNIENLANLDQVPAHGATLIVAPLRITNGSGAPARVFALVPK
jgi:kynurenine formamidase